MHERLCPSRPMVVTPVLIASNLISLAGRADHKRRWATIGVPRKLVWGKILVRVDSAVPANRERGTLVGAPPHQIDGCWAGFKTRVILLISIRGFRRSGQGLPQTPLGTLENRTHTTGHISSSEHGRHIQCASAFHQSGACLTSPGGFPDGLAGGKSWK